MTKVIRKIGRQFTYIVASAIILTALLVSIGRLITPMLNDHLPNFEMWSSQILKTPVKIGHVEIVWNVYEPELAFDHVTILDSKTLQPKFAIEQIKVNLNILSSLMKWQPVTESIAVSGSHLTIRHPASNKFFIEELKDISVMDSAVGSTSDFSEVLGWVFTQANLILEDIDIDYYLPSGTHKSVTIERLALQNKNLRHRLVGEVVFNQDIPTRIKGKLLWTGDVIDLEHINGSVYLYCEGVSLSQWLDQLSWQNLKITQGLGSAKVWATWDKNQFQKIQTQFQFYDVALQSLITQKTQNMQRISGQFRWERQGEKIFIAGREILINLPEHLWPVTYFNVLLHPDQEGLKKIESAQIGYFDLKDTSTWLLSSGLLSDEVKNQILERNPSGEIRDVDIKLFGSLENASSVKMNLQFAKLSFNPSANFPGLKRFRGALNWDGKQGNLNLDSYRASFIMPQLFLDPLAFDQLQAKIQMQRDNNGVWTFVSKNFKAQNVDLKAAGNIQVTIPVNESSSMDLSANFSMLNAGKITQYLPLKQFSSELSEWLQSAFGNGLIEGGQAIVQGRLADFPFENGNGKFLISGNIKDLYLKFAPKWPALEHVNGLLTFSGSSMNADIKNAQIINVPIQEVKATIPYIGDREPQILQVNGHIKSDFSQTMNFIKQSPLKDTIGKSLSVLDITGPMDLLLGLTIPLKTPENTQVSGDLTALNARLELPVNGLALQQLSGLIHFTENDIQSKQLLGKMLNEKATLAIQTQQTTNKTKVVNVNLLSRVSISGLENWLKIPLKQYVSGSTDYQANFFLTSSDSKEPSRVVIKTNLKGVGVTLPDPFGKKTEENSNLQIDLTIPEAQPILAQIDYAKQISAVLSFKKSLGNWKFLRGDVNIGEGKAKLPTQDGLTVTAQFKKLKWDILAPYYNWYKLQTEPKQGKSGKPSLNLENLFRSISLKASNANFWGQSFDQLLLDATKNNNNWDVNVSSVQMQGRANIAADYSQIDAHFDRLYFATSNKEDSLSIDPKTLPALNLSVNDLHYDQMNLGSVSVVGVPAQNGLQIRSLQIHSGAYVVNATGNWLSTRSYLNGTLTTTRLSEMLAAWKMNTAALIGGDTEANFNLNWPGAIFSPALKNLSGTVALKLGPGRIINLGDSVEAKLGLGRLLNILSFKGDLFQNGYSFDSMKGDFKLQNGNAYTNNMRVEGTVASVSMLGRIGLVAKDYDMQLGISAHVTSSLPFIVGAATLNPIAGVATWAVDKIVSGTVSKVTTYNYRVTGSWDNPSWSEIRR